MAERYFYPMLIEHLPDKQGYKGTFIDLNIEVAGESLEKLMENSHKALDECLDDSVPLRIKGTDPALITPSNGQNVVLVEFDRIEYKKKHDKRSITKAVTMPSWMAYMAKERRIDCSKLLQQALLKEFDKSSN